MPHTINTFPHNLPTIIKHAIAWKRKSYDSNSMLTQWKKKKIVGILETWRPFCRHDNMPSNEPLLHLQVHI